MKSIFADEEIKEFVESTFNVNSAIVDELYSGVRKGSVIPLEGDFFDSTVTCGVLTSSVINYSFKSFSFKRIYIPDL